MYLKDPCNNHPPNSKKKHIATASHGAVNVTRIFKSDRQQYIYHNKQCEQNKNLCVLNNDLKHSKKSFN